MGMFDKFKDLIGIEDADADEEITEEEIVEAQKRLENKQSVTIEPRANFSEMGASKPEKAPLTKQEIREKTGAFKLVVIEPTGFDECPKLVDNLKSRKPVIINLEKIESDTARKIFDFLSGATYALNGNVQKIANNIFVFAPENVDIAANVDYKGIDFNNNSSSKGIWR